MKPLRANVLIDSGELIDPSYASGTALEIPDICKRINNLGTIVSVSKGCKYLDESSVGSKCLMTVEHHDDYRIRPRTSKQIGLKTTWHFIVPETCIQALIE